MKRLLLILSLFAAFPSAAQTVSSFLEMAKDDATRIGALAYVRGLIDADRMSHAYLAVAKKKGEKVTYIPLICVPAGGDANQALEIVLKSLRNNPQTWNESAMIIVRTVLVREWPCTDL